MMERLVVVSKVRFLTTGNDFFDSCVRRSESGMYILHVPDSARYTYGIYSPLQDMSAKGMKYEEIYPPIVVNYKFKFICS
jgi:hypothetical protein